MEVYNTVDLTKVPKDILCYNIDSIPRCLIIINDDNLTKVVVYNLLTNIFTENNMDFDNFYSKLKDNAKRNIEINFALDIWFYLYKLSNKGVISEFNSTRLQFFKDKTVNELMIDYFEEIVLKILEKSQVLDKDNIYKLKSNMFTIENDITSFKENFKYSYKKFKNFREIPSILYNNSINPLTTLVEEDVFITYYCTDKSLTINKLFDNIELNESIPFCVFNDYIKVLKNFNVNKFDWLKQDFSKMDIDSLRKECNIRKIDDIGNRDILIERLNDYDNKDDNINYNKNTITLKYKNDSSRLIYETITISLIDEYKIIMNIKTKEASKENLVNSIFSVIKTDQFEEIPSEKRFSGKIYIIDNNKDLELNKYILAHTIMLNDTVFYINEYANASTTNNTTKLQYQINKTIKTSIQNKIKQGNEKGVLNDIPLKRMFIQINISSCKNKEELIMYMKDLTRILYLYYTNLDEYVSFYRSMNSSFKLNEFVPKFKEVRDTSLTDILTGGKTNVMWTRACGNRNIKYYSPEYKDKLKPVNGYEYLFEKDGKQYMLWPKNEDVREGVEQHLFSCEDLEKKYPGILNPNNDYLPCCYKKPFNNYNKYYLKKIESSDNKSTRNLETETILSVNSTGAILNPKILYIVGQNSQRNGINESNYSFLACVMFHMKKKTILPSEDGIKKELQKIINSSINTSFQSNYTLPKDEIIKNILSENYFDPRLYTFLLESYYEINIITFDKNGDIIISRNRNGDLFYKYIDTVFIFENSKNNKKRCEYINVNNIINNPLKFKLKYYKNNSLIIPYIKDDYFKNISTQVLDSFGKCRIINIMYKNKILQAYTFLPPLSVKTDEIKFINNNSELLIDFMLDYNIKILSQYVINDVTSEIKCKDEYGNILYFKLNCEKLPLIKVNNNSKFISTYENNIYDKFVKNKKIAEILKEHILWAFSKSEKPLDIFILECMIEKVNYNYPIVNIINFDNGYFEENKLIIGSKNPSVLKSRLLQHLKLYSIRFPERLKNYKNKQTLSNLFENIRDFKIYVNQYLVFFNKTITAQNNNISIHKNLSDNINIQPYLYFFNDVLYLAQDCHNINTSLYISVNWYLNDYNYKKCSKNIDYSNYTLYDTNNNILKNGSINSPILIKVNNNKYTSLLPF